MKDPMNTMTCPYCKENDFNSCSVCKDYDITPSLSELIDSCGEMKFTLVRGQDGWMAKTAWAVATGKTHTEAVAKLYIALRK